MLDREAWTLCRYRLGTKTVILDEVIEPRIKRIAEAEPIRLVNVPWPQKGPE